MFDLRPGIFHRQLRGFVSIMFKQHYQLSWLLQCLLLQGMRLRVLLNNKQCELCCLYIPMCNLQLRRLLYLLTWVLFDHNIAKNLPIVPQRVPIVHNLHKLFQMCTRVLPRFNQLLMQILRTSQTRLPKLQRYSLLQLQTWVRILPPSQWQFLSFMFCCHYQLSHLLV